MFMLKLAGVSLQQSHVSVCSSCGKAVVASYEISVLS